MEWVELCFQLLFIYGENIRINLVLATDWIRGTFGEMNESQPNIHNIFSYDDEGVMFSSPTRNAETLNVTIQTKLTLT